MVTLPNPLHTHPRQGAANRPSAQEGQGWKQPAPSFWGLPCPKHAPLLRFVRSQQEVPLPCHPLPFCFGFLLFAGLAAEIQFSTGSKVQNSPGRCRQRRLARLPTNPQPPGSIGRTPCLQRLLPHGAAPGGSLLCAAGLGGIPSPSAVSLGRPFFSLSVSSHIPNCF